MNFVVKIVTGDDVFTLIEDPSFISSWYRLSETDDKVTVIQEPSFVATWYRQYRTQYSPVLCLGHNNEEQLVGLMPLALSLKNGSIAHSGDRQAEYHGWISHPDIDQEFPVQCIIAINKTFKLKKWQWRWIPPRAQVGWLSSPQLLKQNIYVKYRKQDSPVWDLSDGEKLKRLIKNGALRNQFNRIKRRGTLKFERISEKSSVENIIDTLKLQVDFRQMTAHGITPFESDPHKKDFYIQRMEHPNDNHFAILWLDDKPMAFNFGACDKQTVYMGLVGYNPIESKNSPGILLIIELAKMLVEQGYRYLDLTPGGDQYKERYSNKSQELILPVFFFGRMPKLKDDVIEWVVKFARKCLLTVGANPTLVLDRLISFGRIRSHLDIITLKKTTRKIFSILYEKHVRLHFKLSKDNFVSTGVYKDDDIHTQQYTDLLQYTSTKHWHTRQQLLSKASIQFKRDEILYSITREGKLAHYGWVTKGGRSHTFTDVDMTFESPKGSMVLYDFYTNPEFRRQGLYQRNLKQMINDCFHNGVNEIYIGTSSNNLPSKKAIENAGFTCFRCFVKTRFLWITRSNETPP